MALANKPYIYIYNWLYKYIEFAHVDPKDYETTLKGRLPNEKSDNFENTAQVIQREYLIKWNRESSKEFKDDIAKSVTPDQTSNQKGLSTRLTDKERKHINKQKKMLPRE